MSVKTDPIPPVPEHTPPLKEHEHTGDHGKKFNQTWSRWFVSLRDKINVINSSIVNLADVTGSGFVTKNGAAWVARLIQGTTGRVTVTNNDGASGDPAIDVVTGDLIEGTNVSFTGSGVGRLIGSASLTINATGGGGGGGSGGVDVQVFATPGSYTWTKPSGATTVSVYVLGAGGGGGSGRVGANSTTRMGGGGGGGGGMSYGSWPAGAIGATETITVGAGGAGGAAQTTDSTNGSDGAAGGASSFGAHLTANGGSPGLAGTNAAAGGNGGAGGTGTLSNGGNGGKASGAGGSTDPTDGAWGGGGGSGGGGIASGNTLGVAIFEGGLGGASTIFVAPGGAVPAAVVSTPGNAGADSAGYFGGGGGSGGTCGNAANAGLGGAGGHGGGGGGGGAALNGFDSAAGGAGGGGKVVVITITPVSGGGGGGGALQFVSEVIVSTAQTDIDFTGLSLDAAGIYRIELLLVPNATGDQAVAMYYNADTTAANYRRRRLTVFSTSSVTTAAASDANISTSVGGTNGATNQPHKLTVEIQKVAGAYPVAETRVVGWSGTGQLWSETLAHSRMNAADVTDIKLRHVVANGFGVGTRARLYKLTT